MARKTITFSLIFLLILILYQLFFTFIKDTHFVSYSVLLDNGEKYNIDEKYVKANDEDYYLIKVSNEENSFVFELDNIFNKQKNIVEDIEVIVDGEYYCIGLNLVGEGRFSYPECKKDNVIYSYSSVKDHDAIKEYVEKNIKDEEALRYSKESEKKEVSGTIFNKNYIEDNEIVIVYNYKQMILHYPNYARSFSFSSFDNYKNSFGYLVGNYYLIPKLTSLPTFTTLIKYEVIDGIKSEITLPAEISKQSYINGVYDNKLYIYDKSNEVQYEIDPYTDTVNVVGTKEMEGVLVDNGEKKTATVYELGAKELKFTENTDDYKSIDYDQIFLSKHYAVYVKDGSFYKVYKDHLDCPIFLFKDSKATNIKLRDDNLYYIKGDSLYKYNIYGSFVLVTRNEFIYNFDNIYDIYMTKV